MLDKSVRHSTAGLVALACFGAFGCQSITSNLGQRYSFEEPVEQVSDDGTCRIHNVRACQQECAKGNAAACNTVAFSYEFGIVGDHDYRTASSYYRSACEGQYAQGCNNLGWLFALGRGVERSERTALLLFTKAFDGYRTACMQGRLQDCVLAANLLEQGLVEAKDKADALALHQRACDLGHEPSCSYRGSPYDE